LCLVSVFQSEHKKKHKEKEDTRHVHSNSSSDSVNGCSFGVWSTVVNYYVSAAAQNFTVNDTLGKLFPNDKFFSEF
jgi:hypothetical protein